MHLEFTYTPEDFSEMYNKAPLDRSRGRRVLRGATIWLIFIGFAIAAYAKFSAPPRPSLDQILALWPWFIIFIVIWILLFRLLRKWHKPWIQAPALLNPRTLDIDNESLKIDDSMTHVQWRWNAFQSWSESTNLFVLHLKSKHYLIIPKRAATPAQQDELRDLLRRSIIPPVAGFPILPTTSKPPENPSLP